MSWREQANCRGIPPSMFFPDTHGPGSLNPGRRFCEDCPVKAQCLEDGVLSQTSKEDEGGLWAGTTFRDRRRLRREVHTHGRAAVFG